MSPILEVLIGMVFVYSLTSILVTQMNTIISELTKLRARHLRGALYELIQDPELRREILTHPLIGLVKIPPELQSRAVDASEALSKGELQRTVTYISPQIFTELILDKLGSDMDYRIFTPLRNALVGAPNDEAFAPVKVTTEKLVKTGEGFMTLADQVSALPESEFKTEMLLALRSVADQLGAMGIEPDDNIPWLLGVRGLSNPVLRNALETLIKTAASVDEARANIETWFNTEMDRATKSFRSSMVLISLMLGLVISVVLNVDSLHIARVLWEDPTLRQAVVSVAETTNIDELQEQVDTAEEETASEDTSAEDLIAATNALNATLSEIEALRIPIGWSFEAFNPDAVELTTRNLSELAPGSNPDGWLIALITKLLGLGATIIAVAQGAPFWFGILRQLSGGSTG